MNIRCQFKRASALFSDSTCKCRFSGRRSGQWHVPRRNKSQDCPVIYTCKNFRHI